MYTQCPKCKTYFQVTADHLKVAQGNVRCGQCRNVFSALGNLSELPPGMTELPDNESKESQVSGLHQRRVIGKSRQHSTTTPTPDRQTKSQRDSNLSQAIDAMRALKNSSAKLQTLEEGRASQAARLKEHQQTGETRSKTVAKEEPKFSSANFDVALDDSDIDLEQAFKAIDDIEIFENNSQQIALPERDQNDLNQTQTSTDNFFDNDLSTFFNELESGEIPFESNQTKTNEPQEVRPKRILKPRNQTSSSDEEIDVDFYAQVNNSQQLDGNGLDLDFQASEEPTTRKVTQPPRRQPQAPPANKKSPKDVENISTVNQVAAHNVSISKAEDTDSQITGTQTQTAKNSIRRSVKEKVSNFVESRAIHFERSESIDERVDNSTDSQINQLETAFKTAKKHGAEKPSKRGGSKQASAAHIAATQQNLVPAANANGDELVSELMELQALIPSHMLPGPLLSDVHQEQVSILQYRHMLVWGAGSLALMIVFLFQTIYFKHEELAKIATFRPWIEAFCRHSNCEVGLRSDIRQIELLGQDIRSHPKIKNALLVSATIINNSGFTQAFPGLRITFSDLNGIKVASRRFAPKEYLPAQVKIKQGMLTNTPIQLELEVLDPGNNAVNFEFDFFPV